ADALRPQSRSADNGATPWHDTEPTPTWAKPSARLATDHGTRCRHAGVFRPVVSVIYAEGDQGTVANSRMYSGSAGVRRNFCDEMFSVLWNQSAKLSKFPEKPGRSIPINP